ncbi:uncharacterized protein LOC107478911 [Arachis duranensis]|uniref:Uncharacterized protein LOC107478911 n=1 Tax=Arachis duranensis TaxID=130453 RepID=A0A9C6WTW5_ARADU|nr:uncharacterized protein LOC107478911 [Arachis duranensis]
MQDAISIPACFSPSPSLQSTSNGHETTLTRSSQSIFMSVYRTKVADQCRLISITWCKNLMLHGLSVSVSGSEGQTEYSCKVELKPWYFWRKQGSKRLVIEDTSSNKDIEIFWDLKNAKFHGETEPSSDYYVAVVCDQEVVLLLGDMKKEAYRRTRCRPSLIDPILVSKKEHIFGKKKFSTRAKFHEKGRCHEISIECKNNNIKGSSNNGGGDNNGVVQHNHHHHQPELEIRFDGHLVIHVKHLQWKFRGNERVHMNKMRVEVYWDVHDWLFNHGLKHALFIFKPVLLSTSKSSSLSSSSPSPSPLSSSSPSSTPLSSNTGSSAGSSSMLEGLNCVSSNVSSSSSSSEFCLFIYAWKVE